MCQWIGATDVNVWSNLRELRPFAVPSGRADRYYPASHRTRSGSEIGSKRRVVVNSDRELLCFELSHLSM